MVSWNEEKNQILRESRGICFEEAAIEIEDGRVLALIPHPTRTNQSIYIIRLHGYTHAVPFVEDDDGNIFLKTIYPSREFQKLYGGLR